MLRGPNTLRPILSEPLAGDPDDALADFLKTRRKATINDVARLSGVSKKTVSRVINNAPSVRTETRERVNETIAKTGFRPDPQARGLAFRRSFLLGLIYDNPNAQYIVTMQMGALDALRGSGTELVVHPCDRRSNTFLKDISDFVERQRLAGVIVLPPLSEDVALLALLEDRSVPYTRVSAINGADTTPALTGHQVVTQDYEGCLSVAQHLAELGHIRMGFIAGPIGYVSSDERRRGFVDGLKRHGLTLDPQREARGGYTFDSGYTAAMALLARPDRPTAILAANDEMAVGAYKAAYELGLRIPADISIIGFDDSHLASRVFPPLSSVRTPIRDMARAATDMLLASDMAPDQTRMFDAVLVVRGSTAPCQPLP
ncbi:MAG: LacI family DNA-binding transcriptional regulator [Asticcacaulis sp.]